MINNGSKTYKFDNKELSSKASSHKEDKFDAVWVNNRKRYRKTLKGTMLTVDPITGYLAPIAREGFTSDKRELFVQRFQICNNLKAICKSVGITIGSFYDAVAVDEKFREDINKCFLIPNRPKHLNNQIKLAENKEKQSIIDNLAKSLDKYDK